MAYEAKVGLNWASSRGPRRAEPGEVVDDLPERSVGWLLADGLIVAVEDEDE